MKSVTLYALKKEIIIDILKAKNIIQQIQHKISYEPQDFTCMTEIDERSTSCFHHHRYVAKSRSREVMNGTILTYSLLFDQMMQSFHGAYNYKL